jgi:uncharacterized protein
MPRMPARHLVAAFLVLLPPTLAPAVAQAGRDEAPRLLSKGDDWKTIADIEKAARAGDPLALFKLAQVYEEGGLGQTANMTKALESYDKAAQAGHSEALFRMGKIHHDGLLGRSVDYARAFSFYKRAAQVGVPEAAYNIGSMLVSGRGVKRDYIEGLAWLMVSERLGAPAAEGIAAVKRQIRNDPKRIAAAESRMAEIERELAGKPGMAPPVASQAAVAPSLPKPVVEPPPRIQPLVTPPPTLTTPLPLTLPEIPKPQPAPNPDKAG